MDLPCTLTDITVQLSSTTPTEIRVEKAKSSPNSKLYSLLTKFSQILKSEQSTTTIAVDRRPDIVQGRLPTLDMELGRESEEIHGLMLAPTSLLLPSTRQLGKLHSDLRARINMANGKHLKHVQIRVQTKGLRPDKQTMRLGKI